MERGLTPQTRILRHLLLLLAVVGTLVALRACGVTDALSRENVQRAQQAVLDAGLWGPLLYLLLCVTAVALFSPATPLLLIGSVFGVARGILYASLGVTLGAAAAFLLARHALRPWVQGALATHPLFCRIEDGVRRDGWRMVLITRLVPVFPFNVQNFAYGLTGIRFTTYVVTSWIGMLPAVAAYVCAAGSLVSGRGDIARTLAYLAVGAVLLVLLSLAPRLAKRWWGDAVESQARAAPSERPAPDSVT